MYAHLERLAMIRGFGVRPIVSDESGGDLVGQEGETVVVGHVRESPHCGAQKLQFSRFRSG